MAETTVVSYLSAAVGCGPKSLLPLPAHTDLGRPWEGHCLRPIPQTWRCLPRTYVVTLLYPTILPPPLICHSTTTRAPTLRGESKSLLLSYTAVFSDMGFSILCAVSCFLYILAYLLYFAALLYADTVLMGCNGDQTNI